MSLAEKEAAVKSIRAQNLNDPEIDELLRQADAKIADEKAALNKKATEGQNTGQEGAVKKDAVAGASLTNYFASIASATSASQANTQIVEALKLFTSPDALVLIIISKSGDKVDYDRPTTIKNYLNYLKDTRNNINKVEKITYDNNGKIKELELLKTY